jgi:hypothetical protein
MGKYLDFFFPASKNCTFNLISPNGGETLTPGAVHQITWNSSNVSGTLKISLWKNGLPLGIIADGIDHTRGSYRWVAGNYMGGSAAQGTPRRAGYQAPALVHEGSSAEGKKFVKKQLTGFEISFIFSL